MCVGKSQIHSLTDWSLFLETQTPSMLTFLADMVNNKLVCEILILKDVQPYIPFILGLTISDTLEVRHVPIKTKYTQQPLNGSVPDFTSVLLINFRICRYTL